MKEIKTLEDFIEATADLTEFEYRFFFFEFFRTKARIGLWARILFPHIIETNEIEDYQKELVLTLAKPDHQGVIEPRGHGKSTWIKIDTLHDIVYKLEPFIVYVGNTMNDAKMHFAAIKNELENNIELNDIYGDLVPPMSLISRKWSDSHFQTNNDIVCIARGAGKGRGANIKNKRPTKIILDDIEDDAQNKSADRREKLRRWVYEVIFPSLHKKRGRVIWIGTVLSVMSEVLAFYKKFGGVFRKAIEDGKPLWGSRYTMEDLEKIKSDIGTRAFSQEYLNTPVNDETSIIKDVWVKEARFSQVDLENMRVVIMVDPQSGEKAMADNFSICVVGFYPKDKRRFVLESVLMKGSQSDQAMAVIKMWLKYRAICAVVGVEKIIQQVAVYQLVLDWKARRIELDGLTDITDRNIPIRSVDPQGKDKVARLQEHDASFERGEILFAVHLDRLIDNLVAFPNIPHDDDVDALVYCLFWSNKITITSLTNSNNDGNLASKKTIAGNLLNKSF